MINQHHIVLLDLDGTLVYPGGYRAAYAATLKELLSQMNMTHLDPGDEVQEYFESLSVNSEWDMLPITLAIILESVYQSYPQVGVPGTFDEAIKELPELDTRDLHIDYKDCIRKLEPFFQRAETPSLGVLNSSQTNVEDAVFPRLSGTTLLEDLLSHTRDIDRSLIIRLFQNFVLGDELFLQTYGVSPQFRIDSYLEKHDQILISREICQKLSHLHHQRKAHLSILTFRPSKPPKEVKHHPYGFPAEAEIAVSLLEMSDIPLIGYGRLEYLANHHNTTADRLVKPSPVQALAAIGAAWTGQEWQSLEWAYQIFHEARTSKWVNKESDAFRYLQPSLPDQFHLHVFEDTPIGITSTQKAAKILERYGLYIKIDAWGIAQNSPKMASLASNGAKIYPTFDKALQDFLLYMI